MKKKITITVSEEDMFWLEAKAKEKSMTVVQFAGELFEKLLKELNDKRNLKKVS